MPMIHHRQLPVGLVHRHGLGLAHGTPHARGFGATAPCASWLIPRGFTLIELLVAIALMAMVSVLSMKAMDSVLRTRDGLSASSQDLQKISALFAQVEADLRQLPPDGSGVAMFGALPSVPHAELMLVRDAAVASEASRLVRVGYRLRDGRVERLLVPQGRLVIQPTDWQPLLGQVRALSWETWERNAWLALNPQELRTAAPEGLQLTVERADGARFVRVYALRQ